MAGAGPVGLINEVARGIQPQGENLLRIRSRWRSGVSLGQFVIVVRSDPRTAPERIQAGRSATGTSALAAAGP
jgi:hypothetical protein